MNGMLDTIIPKSDQLNADDLIGGQTRTIKVTKVAILAGDQPVALSYEGDGGKPYKPGKSMRRVLVNVWGSDGNLYVGRSMTLYRDDNVKFGGAEVGGLRISHMSHITEPVTMALTASRAIRKPFTVKPLVMGDASTRNDEEVPQRMESPSPAISADDYIEDIMNVTTMEGLKHKFQGAAKAFKDSKDFARIFEAKEKRKAELTEDEAK